MSQRSVALAECHLVTTPAIEIAMFHVKHTPIQKPTPEIGRPLHEIMHLWIYGLNGQYPGESCGRSLLTVDFHPPLARLNFNPSPMFMLVVVNQLKESKRSGTML